MESVPLGDLWSVRFGFAAEAGGISKTTYHSRKHRLDHLTRGRPNRSIAADATLFVCCYFYREERERGGKGGSQITQDS